MLYYNFDELTVSRNEQKATSYYLPAAIWFKYGRMGAHYDTPVHPGGAGAYLSWYYFQACGFLILQATPFTQQTAAEKQIRDLRCFAPVYCPYAAA